MHYLGVIFDVFFAGMCEFATLTERKLEKHIILQHENHRPYKVLLLTSYNTMLKLWSASVKLNKCYTCRSVSWVSLFSTMFPMYEYTVCLDASCFLHHFLLALSFLNCYPLFIQSWYIMLKSLRIFTNITWPFAFLLLIFYSVMKKVVMQNSDIVLYSEDTKSSLTDLKISIL